jgi:5-methylcytosine-specific restriction endonuclease McrA
LSAVASGELHLSALCALRPHLTPDNAPDLFAACSRKSRRQVDELLARRFPMSDVRARIRRLPRPANAVFEPLSVDRFAVHFTASATLKTKIETAQALAAHRLPSGGLAALVELAFDALIDRLHKQRFALDAPTRKECSRPALRKMSRPTEPRQARAPTESAPRSRHIPATVRREVFARDGAQCTFIAADGRRCSARALLELDHAEPWALGGPSTPANLRLRCRAHNQLAARQRFGPRCIAAHSAARAAR